MQKKKQEEVAKREKAGVKDNFSEKKRSHCKTCSKVQFEVWKKECALKKRHVDGKFTEDRIIWNKELQKHCEVGCEDVEETSEVQENRIKKCKTDGDRHVTEEGKAAAITDDQELQARAKTTKIPSSL